MVLPCRKHLFSSLNLNTELNSERFSDLLSKNPDITGYVKRLSYRLDNSISDHEMNISGMLKKLSSLHCYSRLNYGHQCCISSGTAWMNRYDRLWYPLSSCPQSLSSTSTHSAGFRQRRFEVVPTSSTSSLETLYWHLLKSIRSSRAVKSLHRYRYVYSKEMKASQPS